MMMNKKRCIILTAYNTTPIKNYLQIKDDDFLICADGGFDFALSQGLVPHVVIGDFDSSKEIVYKSETEIMRVAAEKDDTDTMLCLKYGLEKGFKQIFLTGGLGGRFDHTFANLQVLSYFLDETTNFKEESSIWIADGKNAVTMIENKTLKFHKKEFETAKNLKISLFSYTEKCTGVAISGVKYPLKNAVLTQSFPLGVSNEFLEDNVLISNLSGKLLVIFSQE